MHDDWAFLPQYFPTLTHTQQAYFDSAASTQTHAWVLSAMQQYYEQYRSNSHRATYHTAGKATAAVEQARASVANLIDAQPHQIAFNSGATQGLNTVAHWCRNYPVVIVSNMEHNANLVPWLAQGRSIADGSLAVLDLSQNISDISETLYAAANLFERLAGKAMLSLTGISNVCGTYTGYKRLAQMAKQYGIPVCLDASQLISYKKLPTAEFDGITWAVFSGHKMYGATGTGVLYSQLGFDCYEPLIWGGGNVEHVDIYQGFRSLSGPGRMEAGTANIAGILGIGTAAELIGYATHQSIAAHQAKTIKYLVEQGIANFPDLDLITPVDYYEGKILAFRSIRYHPGDIADLLGEQNIAVRAGKLCAHSYVNQLSSTGVLRVSVSAHTTTQDCDRLISGLNTAIKLLG
jgi:selenocysteine lyase/cysteine desulfurase